MLSSASSFLKGRGANSAINSGQGGLEDNKSTGSGGSSSQFGQSRSPSASPRFGSKRVASPAGVSTTSYAGIASGNPGGLPTIPSSSALNVSGLTDLASASPAASSPRSSSSIFGNTARDHNPGAAVPGEGMSIAAKGRSISLAPGNPASLGLQDSMAGSPREQRLYERGSTTPSSSSNPFSSSFPSSSMWLNERPAPATGGLLSSSTAATANHPPRTTLSRHLSLSGNVKPAPPSNDTGGWPESPSFQNNEALPAPGADAREGRSRSRNLGASTTGISSTGLQSQAASTRNPLARSLSIASNRDFSSGPPSGIAISNMSPFVRDLGQLPLQAPVTALPLREKAGPASQRNSGFGTGNNMAMPTSQASSTVTPGYSASYTASGEFFPGNARSALTGRAFGGKDFSLGAVGSGRVRRESFWGDERGFREGDEDFYGSSRTGYGYGAVDEDDEDEDYAPPTRSGATSRRHSVAAFTSSSNLTSLTGLSSPPARSATKQQMGFHLPGDALTMSTTSTASGYHHGRSASSSIAIGAPASSVYPGNVGSADLGTSSRLDDEDLLATDLSNALQLNLEAQAAKQQRGPASPNLLRSGTFSQATSMPVQSNSLLSRSHRPSSNYGAAGTSPYSTGSNQGPPQQTLASSPPNAGNTLHQGRPNRAMSTSGDPYSPSASAARYLATAHHVQPPPLQPAQVAQMQFQQQQGNSPNKEISSSPNAWPTENRTGFSQATPFARSGTLSEPESMSGSSQPTTVRPLATVTPGFNPSAQTYNPAERYNVARGVSPHTLPPTSHQVTAGHMHPYDPRQLGPLPGPGPAMGLPTRSHFSPSSMHPPPPFAGFSGGGLPFPHHSGPTQTVSHMNAHAQPYYVAPIAPQPSLNELGRGVPLHALPAGGPLYIIEFKAGRTDLFYVDNPEHLVLQKGDLVVVEADRGKDLGKCLTSCTLDEVRDFQMHQVESALGQLAANAGGGPNIGGIVTLQQQQQQQGLPPGQSGQQPTAAAIARMTKEIHPKRVYGRASPADVALLAVKAQDEAKALNVCKAKVVQHQLPMEVTDAEFQFDRRRLTFFYIADRRIDFRNLVKDLFRLYKTRIWLCSIDNGQLQQRPQAGSIETGQAGAAGSYGVFDP